MTSPARTSTGSAVLVILAGGRSTRFGTDKALAAWPADGEPLVVRTLRRLQPVAPRRVVVRASPLPELPADTVDVVRIADPEPGAGPLQALAAAFEQVGASLWFVAPCDLPLLDPAIYPALAAALDRAPVACAAGPGGREPLVAAWTPQAAAELVRNVAERGRDRSMHRFLDRIGAVAVPWPRADDFRNVNTPADLALAATGRSASPAVGRSPREPAPREGR